MRREAAADETGLEARLRVGAAGKPAGHETLGIDDTPARATYSAVMGIQKETAPIRAQFASALGIAVARANIPRLARRAVAGAVERGYSP